MPRRRRASSASIRAPSSRRPRSKPAGALRSPATHGTSHNLFGIKAGASWNGASVSGNHGRVRRRDSRAAIERQFRAYGSVAENVADYVRVLRDNPRYAAALDTGSDVRAFANALQRGGYATDPEYADKLVSVAARGGGNALPPM